MAHKNKDEAEQLTAFVSRTLNEAEKNYADTDRESLALMFALRYFHNYAYGRCLTLITDQTPIVPLLHEQKELPSTASARLQRWSIALAAYNHHIQYSNASDNANADMLSRLTLKEVPAPESSPQIPVVVETYSGHTCRRQTHKEMDHS